MSGFNKTGLKRRLSRQGFSLAEMLVVVTLIGILSSIALPYRHLSNVRTKEQELKSTLMKVRTALDLFHRDWRAGRFSPVADGVSPNGFPKDLNILVNGVASTQSGLTYKYLRRLPSNPFLEGDTVTSNTNIQNVDTRQHWIFRSYAQAPLDQKALNHVWDGLDIYDIKPRSEKFSLSGQAYATW